jgi:putative oxidoreductase
MFGSTSRAFGRWALRYARHYARWALGAALLSGIASRFGWWGPGRGYGTFANFMKYTAQVNSFMPARTIPFLAWAATVAEFSLGLALLLPLRGRVARVVALASAALLAVFGLAMAVSFGPKETLDYSVFSASAAALLLARRPDPEVP